MIRILSRKWWSGGALLLVFTGCSLMSAEKFSAVPFFDGPKVPDRVVAVWEPAVSHDEEEGASRGFGGRVMFFQNKSHEPVKVKGTVVVYAFDETNRVSNDNRPDKKYVFTPDQLDLLYSESDLGHSYNFWLPWGEVNAPEKQVSLIVRFSPVLGSTIVSKQSEIALPGLETDPEREGVRQASWKDEGAKDTVQSTAFDKNFQKNPRDSWDVQVERSEITEPTQDLKKMKTTTIKVPPTFRAHRKSQEYTPLRERVEDARLHRRIQGAEIVAQENSPVSSMAMESPRDSESHFLPRRRRVPGAPIARPNGDGAGRQPRPLMWQSDAP